MKKLLMIMGAVFAFAQMAWAQSSMPITCKGTVYFKAPNDWTVAYIGGMNVNNVQKMTLNANGFYEFDLEKLRITDSQRPYFVIGNQSTANASLRIVTSTLFNVMPKNGTNDVGWPTNDASLRCPGDDKYVYVFENPSVAGKTMTGDVPPGAKFLYVMIPPDYTEWLSANPMISMDGGATGEMLEAVDDEYYCGWFRYIWTGGTISDNVVFYRNDDVDREDMIGLNGNWEESDETTPIPLGMFFEMVDTLYFVPDQELLLADGDDGWYYTFPGVHGTCAYELAAIIYDTDASLHGAFTCATTYYKDMPAAAGLYNGCPTNAPFSYPANQPTPCVGVTQGIVTDVLDPTTKKPTYNTASGCFVSAEAFNAMFQSDTRYNETYCVEIPFTRSSDGKWEFDSDNYTSPGVTAKGGFYPGENMSFVDPTKMLSASVPAAHNKRKAEGPVFMESSLRKINAAEGVPEIDILCNGPGWNKGVPCDGLFAGGGEWSSTNPPKAGLAVKGDGWQWSVMGDGWANDVAPDGWTFYKQGTETAVNVANTTNGYGSGNAARWASGGWVKDDAGKAAVQAYDATVFTNGQGRNQHYCFESHAKFTYRKGLRFSFRGSDDLWVFIDNKLAVDIGGTHLPAPGYVDLDYFKGAGGGFVVGNEYDLDIFFCDRRTTWNSLRIKTNMHILQKTGIEKVGKKNPANMNETVYDICYTKSGDGSCAAAMSSGSSERYCGSQLVEAMNAGLITMSYTLVKGNSLSSGADIEFENASGEIKNCGIDLRNPAAPKINKDGLCGLGGGRYTLFVNIDGKTKKVATFRMSGEVDVVYKNGTAYDTTGKAISGGKYTLLKTAMAGQMVPVYVSSVAPASDGKDEVDIYPEDAKGVEYTLAYDRIMKAYAKEVDPLTGTESYVKLASGATRKIGDSGVDTVYVTVDMNDMTKAIQNFSVSVSGKPQNALNISFYLPQITFIEKIPEVGETAKSITGPQPEPDGTYEELWVGAQYEMYLAVLKPNADGWTYSPCLEECDGLEIHKGTGTSPKVEFVPDKVKFKDGYATISVRSLVAYRWDTDPSIHSPATIVAEYNDYVQAAYNPMYFRDPPMPYPVLAEVFDVRGSLPTQEYKIPAPYFNMYTEYLDGIGDSVAIYYDRPLHRDSLPKKVCIMWDSATAEHHNPYAEGFSTIPKDSTIACNELVSVGKENIDCSHSTAEGLCSNVITIGNLKLSSAVKTAGVGFVSSYVKFGDKGKVVRQGFKGPLTDRIAPVPLRAEVRAFKDGGKDSVVVIMSEPVKLVTSSNKKNALEFYLNASEDLSDEKRFVSALGGTGVLAVDKPEISSTATGEGRIKYVYKRSSVSPRIGDYVRLGGKLSNVFWSDTADLTLLGGDTLRSTADAKYHWNSPTAYNETKRLPSRWIPIISLDPETIENESDFEYADPSFRVRMVGPFEFAIVMDNSVSTLKRNYVVMDLQGRIVHQGEIASAETIVPVLNSGTYVVKIGPIVHRVNVH